MNKIVCSCLLSCVILFGCKENNSNLLSDKSNQIVQIETAERKAESKEILSKTLSLETDFTLKVHIDSMKFNTSYDGYNALPLSFANQVRNILREKEIPIEKEYEKFYCFKSITIDENRVLELVSNGAKYGYNAMYAVLIDNQNAKTLSVIPIAKLSGDVGDYNVMETRVIGEAKRLILGVYKKYHTDDFTMGNHEGMYKLHYDSLLIYEVKKDEIDLLEAKSSF